MGMAVAGGCTRLPTSWSNEMKAGVIGLGKLGLPVAVAMSAAHSVLGYDVNPNAMRLRSYEQLEAGPNNDAFQPYFDRAIQSGAMAFAPLSDVVKDSDIIFVAVQTPHKPSLDGSQPLGEERADFDYSYLKNALTNAAPFLTPDKTLVIISTVLPGTVRRELLPIVAGRCKLVYQPYFIAMSTVMPDFLHPEFILCGMADGKEPEVLRAFYSQFHQASLLSMSYESAELAKCAYNLFVSLKVAYSNLLGEMSHNIPGCNVDDVTKVLSHATDRLLSPKYLSAGGQEGGNCHPRDSLAMSWLTDKLGLSYNPFEFVMEARERQTRAFADLIESEAAFYDLPVVILGRAFKPETNITAGSYAVLLANILTERGVKFLQVDPMIDYWHVIPRKSLFFVATKHVCFKDWKFDEGSVVIDPHRYIPEQEGVTLIPLGIGK